MIVGAGLPRSLAFLFSLLTLWQLLRLYTHKDKRHVLYASAFAGLTVLSHPTIRLVHGLQRPAHVYLLGRQRTGWLRTGLVALGNLVLTAPWWLTILARHGLSPFLSASQLGFRSWISLITPLLFLHTNEPYLKIQAVLGLLGLFACLQKRQYFLPAWLGLVFLWNHAWQLPTLSCPWVLLVAIGLDEVVLGGLRNLRSGNQGRLTGNVPDTQPSPAEAMDSHSKIPGILLSVFLIYTLVSSFIAAPNMALSA